MEGRRGTLDQVNGYWRARLDGEFSGSFTVIEAILGLISGVRPDLILTDLDLSEDEIASNEAFNIPFLTADGFIHLSHQIPGCGESVAEHPSFVECASVYPSEMLVAEDLLAGGIGSGDEVHRVGALGHMHFELDCDAWLWTFLGWFDSAEEAAAASAGVDFRYELDESNETSNGRSGIG